ncbi:hypothetical protein AB0M36_12005 [Actinoplanes sp. NPDC051346]
MSLLRRRIAVTVLLAAAAIPITAATGYAMADRRGGAVSDRAR